MSRHRHWSSSQEALSPFNSQHDGGVPTVTDQDFSYITSEDLEEDAPRGYGLKRTQSELEDDVLLVKHKSTTQRTQFPAYSIGDGKLRVRDVRDRIGVLMDLSDRRTRRIKMLYKGKHLKEPAAPIRDYGVKNNSEIMVVVPEGPIDDDEDDDSSESEEVIVTDPLDGGEGSREKKKRKNRKTGNKKKKRSPRSPRDSALEVPGLDDGRKSDDSRHPSRVPSPALNQPAGPLEKLEMIKSHFNKELLPLCQRFAAHPPADQKKVEDEHRKLSETVMQQVLLKLDEIETGGDPEIRAKRKEIVNMVHEVLREIDQHVPEERRNR